MVHLKLSAELLAENIYKEHVFLSHLALFNNPGLTQV